ncbi:MAG: family 43 glycosylhydrolase, partial [Actinomadura rubrobrunea]|nr:family 43 glycosylhydrolase [Actinomadura rubrobrunea]
MKPSKTFRNPILPGVHPDPSVCRVGADYYLVTSTFEWFPGLPVYHSRDLVHWRPLGHVLDRPSQLDLDGIRPSAGLYAPTIRHHDGVFYVVCTLVDGPGHFVVTATDPAGPWSEPTRLEGSGIDPSLFF